LHGFSGSPASWDAAIERAPGPCLALPLPGHCGTECGDSFAANVDAIAAAITAAKERGCHLVGYSLGARLALGVLIAHPEIASTATLIGCHFGIREKKLRGKRRDRDRGWAALLREEGIETFVQRWESLPLFATQSAAIIEAQRAIRRSHQAVGLARSLETCGLAEMPSFWGRLPILDIDVELVTGALDSRFTALAREAVSHNVRFSRRTIPDVGHNVPLENPRAVWGS
jgi:2-succinyl-6-hydroxy-2,4-cyclohexadiene-1-carboxylate synthase